MKTVAKAKSRVGSEKANVSGRWLLGALALSVSAAVFCGWGALCLLFWQGSWQLLYHPAAAITRTPASMGMPFDPVEFAATDTGTPRLAGWWIAATPGARFSKITVLYLHGQNGDLSDTVDALATLHAAGVNVLAFDYRGYGKSHFVHPSEAHWREDADWAFQYLTGTRHVPPGSIVLDGTGLGANLALEIAAAHPELAGVIVEEPDAEPMNALFGDARAHLLPAHLLVHDRYDIDAAAAAVRVPVLWLARDSQEKAGVLPGEPDAYKTIAVQKMLVWANPSDSNNELVKDALGRWLGELPMR